MDEIRSSRRDFPFRAGRFLEGRTMTSANDPHPSPSELTAFVHGLLPAAERTAVEAHFARCAECRARLAALPENTLASQSYSPVERADTGPLDIADYATSLGV